MTGYARTEGRDETQAWVWDLRSVNGKGLDVRCRLPAGFETLDRPVRERLAKAFSRGSVNVGLTVSRAAGAGAGLAIDRAWLDALIALAEDAARAHPGLRPTSVGELIQVRGVAEPADAPAGDEETAARDASILAGFDAAVAALAAARRAEGSRIAEVVAALVEEIAALVDAAAASAAAQPAALKDRLRRQVAELLEASALPEARIAAEAALLATRFDVREELDRLKSHIAAARNLLAQKGPVGRRFDFLCQEFNREANTLCSKSADAELTAVGLDLKTAIDRLREQIQNIE